MVILSEVWASIVQKLAPPPAPPAGKPEPTPDEVRLQRRQIEALRREAQMLGVDVDLERAGRE